MKKTMITALVLSVAVSTTAILADDAKPADKNPMQLTDLNKPVLLKSDQDEVTLRLPANRTTGYAWFLMDVNHNLLEPESASYQAPDNKNGLVGAPGVAEWKFKVNEDNVKVPMVTTIKMAYMRPWEMAKESDVKSIDVVLTKSDD